MPFKCGIHIGKGHDFAVSLETICVKYGFDAAQIFTVVPERLKLIKYDADAVRTVIQKHKLNVWIHTSYLVSPWGSAHYHLPFCRKQLKQQIEIGAKGVVFHMLKIPAISMVKRFKELLSMKPRASTVLIENIAVKSDPLTSYETPEKINALIDTFLQNGIALKDINLAIDTSHVYCGQSDIRSYNSAKRWLATLKYPRCIKLFHLNGNGSDNLTDIHRIAFGSEDRIWNGIPKKESGVQAIKEFCNRYSVDVILECNFENEMQEALDVIKFLKE